MTSNNKIVWLASYPKSGNTWTRLFLASFVADKSDFDPNKALLGSYHDAARVTMSKLLNVDTTTLDTRMVSAMRMPYLAKLAERSHSDIMVKTHVVNGVWNDVPTSPLSLTRRAIYIVRHPFDVAVSFSKHMGFSVDDAIAAMGNPDFGIGSDTQVKQPMHTWSGHVQSWMECVGYDHICIRYEDMHKRPLLTFSNVLGLMGMKPDAARIQRAIDQVTFSKLKRFEDEHGFKEKATHSSHQFFSKGKIGTWRDVLTKEQAKQLWNDHHVVMERLGYGPDGEF